MKDWKGCRGLEPAVALLVENAMPPYLIGVESNDLQPFSASKMTMKTNSTGVTSGQAPRTMFETLTARLGDFVRAARERSIVITDDLLRKEARLILFGDDDPWNQTPVDHPEWLELFKKGYGLPSASATCGVTAATAPLPYQDYGLDPSTLDTNPSPFTPERMRQAAFFTSSLHPHEACGGLPYNPTIDQQGDSLAIPWSWQTPECLAEFSQMCETAQETTTVDATDDFSFDIIFSNENRT
jgi:hypothetical protein